MDCDLWQSQVTPAAQVEVTHTAPPRVTQSSQASYALPSTEPFTRAVISGGRRLQGLSRCSTVPAAAGLSQTLGAILPGAGRSRPQNQRERSGENTPTPGHTPGHRGASQGRGGRGSVRTSLKVLGRLGSTEG